MTDSVGLGKKQERFGFIGGSDVSRIMSGDWHSLWQEKTRRAEPEDLSDNLAVQIGTFTEPVNLRWANKKIGHARPYHEPVQQWIVVDDKPYLYKGQLDGVSVQGKDIADWYVVECKHTNERSTMDTLIERYYPQMQFYIYMLGTQKGAESVKGCYLSVIFGNSKHECVLIDADNEYIEKMLHHIRVFVSYIVHDTEPELNMGVVLSSPHTKDIPINGMSVRDVNQDNHYTTYAHDYIDTLDASKKHEDAKKQMKSMMADDERELSHDILSVYRDSRGAKRFKIHKSDS